MNGLTRLGNIPVVPPRQEPFGGDRKSFTKPFAYFDYAMKRRVGFVPYIFMCVSGVRVTKQALDHIWSVKSPQHRHLATVGST